MRKILRGGRRRLGALGAAGALLATGVAGASGTAAHAADGANGPVVLTTPGVAAGGQAVHTVTVDAAEGGVLTLGFQTADDQRPWGMRDEWSIGLTVGAPDGVEQPCTYPGSALLLEKVSCELPAGRHTLTYRVSASASVPSWHIVVDARFAPASGAADATAAGRFDVAGVSAVPMDWDVLARDRSGDMRAYGSYEGEGSALDVEWGKDLGVNWGQYDRLTKLAPIDVRGRGGDVVARDASGVLWYHRLAGGGRTSFEPPVRVGSGWGAYRSIRGAGDLTGDGRHDLLAVDGSGVLWLYRGTGDPARPFEARRQAGTGWNIYTSLTGGLDVTGDRKADLIARDGSGALWLYQGTGDGNAPLQARRQIGTGWNIYDVLVAYGDVTADGHPELLARDTAGVLWQYTGTGNAAAPFRSRVQVAQYWDGFDAIL
ncbi:VCBS repeat-containing protein [Streptomyces sp. TRM76323]|uniref:VCBS repeat-containing protein n=1 Tax=Streptomyces tamarix TaxID=3078565 RepID=A0ABU3QME5_9ACTN|nr:VCBS repeat-containing protein [Streptomyces tamarix]MDT9683930.1 VCBS repeat-containing protein [Streptomyces tamarix]